MYRCVLPLGTSRKRGAEAIVNPNFLSRSAAIGGYGLIFCLTHESTDFSLPGIQAGCHRANGFRYSSCCMSTFHVSRCTAWVFYMFHRVVLRIPTYQSSIPQLINLYIAKGHSTAECRRFLKHKKTCHLRAPRCGLLRVSHSVSRSLFHTFYPQTSQGDAGDFHGRRPTKTPWISCDMSQGRWTQVPADDMTPLFPALCLASMVVSCYAPKKFPSTAFCSHYK